LFSQSLRSAVASEGTPIPLISPTNVPAVPYKANHEEGMTLRVEL
jgi:hypothetical protein